MYWSRPRQKNNSDTCHGLTCTQNFVHKLFLFLGCYWLWLVVICNKIPPHLFQERCCSEKNSTPRHYRRKRTRARRHASFPLFSFLAFLLLYHVLWLWHHREICYKDFVSSSQKHVQVTKMRRNQGRNYSARSTWQLLHKCKTTNHCSVFFKFLNSQSFVKSIWLWMQWVLKIFENWNAGKCISWHFGPWNTDIRGMN